jgi:hypothetical protein
MPVTAAPPDAPEETQTFRTAVRGIAAVNATMVLVGVASSLVLAVVVLTLGLSVGKSVVLVGLAATTAVPALYLSRRLHSPRVVGLGVIVFVGVVLVSGTLGTVTYDSSWDGRGYHQYAIHLIDTGFNPVRETQEPASNYNLALNHYPKAAWYVGASLTDLTKRLESAKALNFLLAFGAACLAFLALEARPWASLPDSLVLAGLITLNPVIVTQLFTHYVDGLGASVLTMLLSLSVLLWQEPRGPRLVDLFLVLVIGLNIKFTTTATVVFFLPFLLLSVWHRRASRGGLRRVAVTVVVGCLVGLVLVGYSPYVRNTLEQGNPLYPTFASAAHISADSILAPQIGGRFLERSRVSRLAVSLFSESQNDPGAPVRAFKPLYQASRAEFFRFTSPDVRIGGFGPWFGALLLLSLTGMAVFAGPWRFPVLGAAALLLVSCLFHDGGWWARYSPQPWLIPVLALAVPWSRDGRVGGAGALRRIVRGAVLTLALVNATGIVFQVVKEEVEVTLRMRSDLHALQELAGSGAEILFYPDWVAASYLLAEHGIPHVLVDNESDLPCPRRITGGSSYSTADCSRSEAGRRP